MAILRFQEIMKENKPSNISTPKHSLLAKTTIWYLNGTNPLATSMQVSLIPETLYKLPNFHPSNEWCDVRK